MSREAAYSTGNKIYGGGRPHPTSGPVDPTGYVERSMNKASSNRRSGLAAAAGRRLQGGVNATQPNPLNVGAGPISAQPSMAAPIVLADGRKVITNATGQYTFVEEEPFL